MGHTETDRGPGGAPAPESSFPYAVLRSRWLLVVAVTALVAFGGPAAPTPTQYALAGAMILSNLALAMLRQRGLRMTQALEVLTMVDVLVVTLVVYWVDPSRPTYLAVFAALVLAAALARVPVIMMLMVLVCAAYAIYLFSEIGPGFWRQVALVLRVPFIFAVGLHFASIASHLKKEKGERETLVAKAKQHAERAEHLSKEQDRLRALSQIGRVALTSSDTNPVRVLLEMAHRAQRALDADRCSLIVFPRNAQEAHWNGRTKDRNIEVRSLPVDPTALRSILADGKITELHPGDDKDLMERVKPFFPDSNPFGSLLVAPIAAGDDDTPGGALFLLDADHKRRYNDGEVDFFWTVALMTGAYIHAREKLEHEVQLRTLITNAPVIMFALTADGVITLFEGRGAAVLQARPEQHVGKSLLEIVGNPEETREAFETALAGRIAAGSMLLEDTLFETQYSPLRGVDGEIAGVMGVTTAILGAPTAKPATPGAGATAGAPAEAPITDPAGRRRPASPSARPDLKPMIPLADED